MDKLGTYLQKAQHGIDQKMEIVPTSWLEAMKSRLVLVLAPIVTEAQAVDFTQKVANYTGSDDFTEAVSQAVGRPYDGETEDQFTIRAKAQIRSILAKKFGGK